MDAFKRYKNLVGKSCIAEYAYDDFSIHVRLHDGMTYVYTFASVGADNFLRMVELAKRGIGLNSFIMRNPVVRKGFQHKY